MIERIGNAIIETARLDRFHDGDAQIVNGEEIARAVLAAIREPTRAMQVAAYRQSVTFHSASGMTDIGKVCVENDDEPDKGAATLFTVMIDAALAEGE